MKAVFRMFMASCLMVGLFGGNAFAAKKAIATLRAKSKATTKVNTAAKKKFTTAKRQATQVKALIKKASALQKQYKATLAQINRLMKQMGGNVGTTVQGKKKCPPKCQERRFKRMQRRMKRLAKKNGWDY